MFKRRKPSSNASRVTITASDSGTRRETVMEGARRAYLTADPLDPSATVDFLLAMESNPSIPINSVDYTSVHTTHCAEGHALTANHYIHPERLPCGCPSLDPAKNPGMSCAQCGRDWEPRTSGFCYRCEKARERRGGCSGCETAQTMGGECYRVCTGQCASAPPITEGKMAAGGYTHLSRYEQLRVENEWLRKRQQEYEKIVFDLTLTNAAMPSTVVHTS